MLLLDDDDELPTHPRAAEAKLARRLGKRGLQDIDAALISHATGSWRKVAFVVSRAVRSGGFRYADDAVQLHVRRIGALVKLGQLEAEGDLRRPRFSEVRLPHLSRLPT